jgi:hypothetical protein
MPYYKEIYLDGIEESEYRAYNKDTGFTAQHNRCIAPAKVVKINTFRSRPSTKAVTVQEVPETVADPYGYFLTSGRDHKWEKALKARGMDVSSMEPDRGHSFKLESWLRSRGVSYTETYAVNGVYSFENVWHPTDFAYASSTADTSAKEYWGKAAPRSEVFDAGVFAGELREGLPKLVPELLKGKAGFFKSAGSDYLNVQFGWKPFLSDLQNAARALSEATQWVTTPIGPIHRTRGRKLDIAPVSVNTGGWGLNGPVMGHFPSFISSQERTAIFDSLGTDRRDSVAGGINQWFLGSKVHLQEKQTWFEGNFFLLPKVGFDPSNFLDRLTALVDTNITPSTLWELAPWSWLVDWFSHVGDSLSLAETLADDRVHAQYAYGMETYKSFSYWDGRFAAYGNGYVHSGPTFPSGSSELYIRKERVRANPYGFIAGGKASLNEGQNAILLALGLTKIGR